MRGWGAPCGAGALPEAALWCRCPPQRGSPGCPGGLGAGRCASAARASFKTLIYFASFPSVIILGGVFFEGTWFSSLLGELGCEFQCAAGLGCYLAGNWFARWQQGKDVTCRAVTGASGVRVLQEVPAGAIWLGNLPRTTLSSISTEKIR